MSDTRDQSHDPDARFVRSLAEHYRPEPPGPAQTARFEAELRARLRRPRWPRYGVPALAAGVACALALVLWGGKEDAPVRGAAPDAGTSVAADLDEPTWESQLLLGEGDAGLAEEDYLPEEYLAIASAFLDGP